MGDMQSYHQDQKAFVYGREVDNTQLRNNFPTPRAQTNGSYYYKPSAREMYPGDAYSLIQKAPPTVRTNQQWIDANATARLAAQPRTGPFTQLDTPVVSSLNPHQMVQNPLDPFQTNIYYMLQTFKKRNNSTDPRGQPGLPSDWLGDTDQLVQIRNVARLEAHGNSIQITGCTAPRAPVY